MKMRMPAIPLITVDPYFSVWSYDKVNTHEAEHWTGGRNTIRGYVKIDSEIFRFLGRGDMKKIIPQVSVDADALSTTIVYENAKIRLTAVWTSPMLVTDLYLASRPVSYLKLSYESLDGCDHDVSVKLYCSEELTLNNAGDARVISKEEKIGDLTAVRMGRGNRNVLWRSDDLVRIDWGWFYMAVKGEASVGNDLIDDLYTVYAETKLNNEALFLFAYDDIYSLEYFGERVKAYWKKDGKSINDALLEAAEEYESLTARCKAFSDDMYEKATCLGGEEYAEMLQLCYRQVMAAHKLAVDNNGELIYISKECDSNGCAATVDVTYPSAPMYLYYNPELLKAMLNPIIKFAKSDAWPFDFAPHDVGQYPLVNGQVYRCNPKNGYDLEHQMPVEECGNMLILIAAICDTLGDYSFAKENIDLLEMWKEYLVKYGEDPENQLCTDDFAGTLAHNCNLSIKAIMGIVGYSKILSALGNAEQANTEMQIAKKYAQSFLERAKNSDGSYALTYDRPETFSLKYNAVWDMLWKTDIFPESFYNGELTRYKKEMNYYGVPLDSREKYTKSDWTMWIACMADSKEDFEFFAKPLWSAYNTMRTRFAMTDWYYTDTSEMKKFRHRSVQGGLFFKFLMEKK
ncbi:MAG: DUF4965 domain-containing protein [Clostridia bacterium]|nr:DUF4965 domain-containing protein [Clostridia bacterium]